MNKLTLVADSGQSGQRLDVFLAAATDKTRNFWQQQIKGQTVTVNGDIGVSKQIIRSGDKINWNPAPIQTLRVLPEIRVVFEDANLAVIDKPAGILMHPHATSNEPTVADYARKLTADPDPIRPGIVHRLDRDTSGLVIVAKTVAAKSFLQQQFQKHSVHKTYLALLEGHIEPAAAIIKLPVGPDRSNASRRIVKHGGKLAITKYHTLKNPGSFSLVEAEPETGRTHQLRVHFAHLKHPIAGDRVYGQPTQGLKRQFLHASKLMFMSPSGQQLQISSDLPADLAAFLKTLA